MSTITDDFSSDTSANYQNVRSSAQGVSVSSGKCHSYNATTDSWSYHKTSTGNNDHVVSADILVVDIDDSCGVLFRCNGIGTSSTGYYVLALDGNVVLYRFSGGTRTYIAGMSITWSYGETRNLKIVVIGNEFSVYIDNVYKNKFSDSTYSSGMHCGLFFRANGGGATVDNFYAYGDASSGISIPALQSSYRRRRS